MLEVQIAYALCDIVLEAYREKDPLFGKLQIRGLRVLAQSAGLSNEFMGELWNWERFVMEHCRQAAESVVAIPQMLEENGYATP